MSGKIVLLTGAGSGIGAGTAVYLESQGCLLSLTDKNLEGLEETLRALVKNGATEERVLLIPADLHDTGSLAQVVVKTVDKFGKLDVLINCAGCARFGTLGNFAMEDYDAIMNTNLKSVFFLTQHALPHLIKSKGNVVNVSSVGGQRPHTISVAYGPSKAALDHFTRIVALDVASKGVRVNAVNPGMVRTPLYRESGLEVDLDELEKRFHAMGRSGRVEEVAKAIWFLADESRSSFITGVTLLVDGGSSLLGAL